LVEPEPLTEWLQREVAVELKDERIMNPSEDVTRLSRGPLLQARNIGAYGLLKITTELQVWKLISKPVILMWRPLSAASSSLEYGTRTQL
jgi:hypothetical protein